MAVDTREKRTSLFGLARPTSLLLIAPSGAVGVAARHDFAFLFPSADAIVGVLTTTVEQELAGVGVGWTDVTDDVTDEPIIYDYGNKSTRPDARMAGTGSGSYGLRNDADNSGATLGWYSPYNASRRTGFDFGIRTRITLTYAGVSYRWMGRLNAILAVSGKYDEQVVHCLAYDWMDEAARAVLALPLQQNQRGDQIFTALLGNVPLAPDQISADLGSETYVFGLDNIPTNTKVSEALRQLAMSELGFIGVKRDTVNGQTAFYEARSTRPLTVTPAVSLDDTEVDVLEVPGQRADVINRVRATVHPRTPDTGVSHVVATLAAGSTSGVAVPEIPPGATITFWLDFTDPANRTVKIGAYNCAALVAGTDWLVNAAADGSGADLTSDFTLVPTFIASGVRFVLASGSASAGHLTHVQVYGDRIDSSNPATVEGTSATSIAKYGDNPIDLDFSFLTDLTFGKRAADGIAACYGTPSPPIQAVQFLANRSDKLMQAALQLDISSRVSLTETVSGIARDFFINAVRHEIADMNLLWCTWLLSPVEFATWWTPNSFSASGGSESTSAGVKIHAYTTPGSYTFTVTASSDTPVTIKVVPGGGGPGAAGSGALVGGGAAGDIQEVTLVLAAGTYTVVVGAGGVAGADGADSSFDTTVATKGLHGSAEGVSGQNGALGSGPGNATFVGSGGDLGTGGDWQSHPAGTGTIFPGGADHINAAGGGAGRGAKGGDATQNNGGPGGAGVTIAMGGLTLTVAAGGPGAGLTSDGAVPTCDYGRGGYRTTAGQGGGVWVSYPTYL